MKKKLYTGYLYVLALILFHAKNVRDPEEELL